MITMHVYRKLIVIAATVISIVLAALPSPAQTATPCNETISKYCKDVVPGNGRIMKCLNDHRDDQSISCKDWIEEQQKSMQELMTVCPEDIARWCRNVSPDKISIYFCLLDNYISLRLDCRSRLGEVRDRLK
jgi:hypothetical protein